MKKKMPAAEPEMFHDQIEETDSVQTYVPKMTFEERIAAILKGVDDLVEMVRHFPVAPQIALEAKIGLVFGRLVEPSQLEIIDDVCRLRALWMPIYQALGDDHPEALANLKKINRWVDGDGLMRRLQEMTVAIETNRPRIDQPPVR